MDREREGEGKGQGGLNKEYSKAMKCRLIQIKITS